MGGFCPEGSFGSHASGEECTSLNLFPSFIRGNSFTPLSFHTPVRKVKNVKWVTRVGAKVDRIECPWLIKRFVDPDAEFLYIPKADVLSIARERGAIPFDSPGAELNHYEADGEERCSFDAIIRSYGLNDPALLDMAEIVRTADTASRNPRPEGAGLESLALGFHMIAKDDFENVRLQFPDYDALYAYCKLKVKNKSKLEHAIKNDHDEIPYSSLVAAEIRERMRADEKLKESEAMFRLILDSTAEAIYGLDMQGNCTFCNNSCLSLLGYDHPEELLGVLMGLPSQSNAERIRNSGMGC